MRKYSILCILAIFFIACEDVYIPRLETVEGVIFADARIIAGKSGNFIYLNKTIGFNDKSESYPPVEGATVLVIDNKGIEVKLAEAKKGAFNADIPLNPDRLYKLRIKVATDIFESDFQEITKPPSLDTVYGEETEKIFDIAATKNVNDFERSIGIQLYTDIRGKGKVSHYRFYARKILQYNYELQIGDQESHTMYCWKSLYPTGSFNIAGPADYSTSPDIVKHQLEFLEKLPYKYLSAKDSPRGWIYILFLYGISESSYNYYRDLNNQLDANGKLFDPMYVQPRGIISCTTDPEKVILGNFEISSLREYRYFVNYSSSGKSYLVKPVQKFYDIPKEGVQQDIPPVFWEH